MTQLRRYTRGALAPMTACLLLTTVPAWGQEGTPPGPSAPTETPNQAGDDVDLEVGTGPEQPSGAAPGAAAAEQPSSPSPAPAAPAAPSKAAAAPEAAAAPSQEAVTPEPAVAGEDAANPGAAAAEAKGAVQPASRTEPDSEARGHFRAIGTGLEWGSYLQAQYEHNQLSEDQLKQGEILNQDRFVLRRARLRLDYGSEFSALTFELDANTVNGLKVGVRRGEAAVLWRSPDPAAPPWVMLSAGITDIPFGAEIVESPTDRVFMERSPGSRAIFPTEADVGAKLQLSYGPFLAVVAVMNGEPLDSHGYSTDPNTAKDIIGHVAARAPLGKGVFLEGGASLATGKGFHAGTPATKDSLVWVDDDNDGVAQSTELKGIQGSAATASEDFDRDAVGLDLRLTVPTPIGNSELFAEAFVANNYDRALLISDPIQSGIDVRQLGATASLSQQVTRWAYAGFRASLFDPNSDVFEQRKGRILPVSQEIWTLSPVLGASFDHARVSVEYDIIFDSLARDEEAVPTDAKNNLFTARVEVSL